ncbi:MAG: asparagine--tRNA ligase [Defluviitaleaceae bacterium]|nr:asparagine--tRNA ligase [Defluviitaleaceae bacterium]
MYTRIKDLHKSTSDYLGKDIKIGGWIRTLRDGKNVGFIELNDGSFFRSVQVVFEDDLDESGMPFNDVVKLGVGACVTVIGQAAESPGAKQPFEIKAKTVLLEGSCPSDYPLQKKRHGFEFLRTIAHLRPRTNTYAAVFRVRSLASFAVHEFFHKRGFVHVHTPIITGNDGEGHGEMFGVTPDDFFGKQAMLAVTGQLHVEPFCLSMRDVYTFGPTFRAEHSNTTTHAAEFWMIEPELAFADLNDNLENAEAMLKHVIRFVLENAPEEMAFFEQWIEPGLIARLQSLVDSTFARCTYTEGIAHLEKSGKKFEFPFGWGMDLKTEHERYICEEVYKGPVFLTDYPRDFKAFYMRLNDDRKTVACADLLVPGIGELIGGSQREERIEELHDNLAFLGLNPEDYDWYIDLRRFGGVRHSGYGMGFERFLMYVTGMKNIRDVIPYPRTVDHLSY